jgi:hypothetical protein
VSWRTPSGSAGSCSLAAPGRASLNAAFDEIEPLLYRFSAIDPSGFSQRVEEFLA